MKREHREAAEELRERRSKWSRGRLEASGLAIFDATASPESDLFGEKVVRVCKEGATRLADRFSRGDILVIGPDRAGSPSWSSAASHFAPRECVVISTGKDWLTVGVGRTWPRGLWEARRRPGSFGVMLERAVPQASLKAQQESLYLTRMGLAGGAAALLTSDAADLPLVASRSPPWLTLAEAAGGNPSSSSFSSSVPAPPPSRSSTAEASSLLPSSLSTDEAAEEGPGEPTEDNLTEEHAHPAIRAAILGAKQSAKFVPNRSQEDAIAWALGRSLALIRGPPGTGKTRTAALLIASALRLGDELGSHPPSPSSSSSSAPEQPSEPPRRVLAVAHSNGAADVLLLALLRLGVPAVRAGRPAAVSPSVRSRTVVALAERHPETIELRTRSHNASLPPGERAAAATELRAAREAVGEIILHNAQVVVSSCVGAHQLLESNMSFPLVVLDEGSQATEPALLCALSAAKASQLVIVGDTKQLPPTVASSDRELRRTLGTSPMARLEGSGVGQRTLQVQYRMPPELLEHPSSYFYDSLVSSARNRPRTRPPRGFEWPRGLPLCLIHVGHDDEISHQSGGRSNPREADLVASIVFDVLAAGDVRAENVAVIAPYSSQVDAVRARLFSSAGGRPPLQPSRGGGTPRVGTVDSFQGQETDLVILSATRSNSVGDVGFLSDPRRLCVAITRARRGLIVVGDVRTLRTSHHWAALVESCRARGCLVDSGDLSLGAAPSVPTATLSELHGMFERG